MPTNLKFKDLNFKLLVIDQLMYKDKILKPEFKIEDFVKNYKKRKIVIKDDGYEPIPEILDYFKKLKITDEDVKNIKSLFQDSSNKIYKQICPLWDEEGDEFNLQSAEDAQLLPQLKKITLFFDDHYELQDEFNDLGIEFEYL